jgi:molybdopterin synthase catalytic subunit
MKATVKYFATLRDRAGTKEEAIELAEGATVRELKAAIETAHPDITPSLPTSIVAVNREYASDEQILSDGDEVALFPPVSGGSQSGADHFQITGDELDLNGLLSGMILPTTGAACVFTGMVRGLTERGQAHETEKLQYEAYQPMAQEKMVQVAGEIRERWPQVESIAIVQRVGELKPGTPTVLIACTAAHRDTGVFEAARYGIDRLKEIVPIWKKEVGPGGETWVEGGYLPTPEDRSPSAT